MDAAESPLDVLTRAATMVQNNVLPPSYEEARICREEAGTGGGKWRRQRHGRRQTAPPNYTNREPIDLSTRKMRGSPPSYLQTMQAKQAASALARIDSGGVCDPMIDEHFRRSLGKDYLSTTAEQSGGNTDSTERLDDSSSLSVDDHFAKALGDTWVKLQKEEMEKERAGSGGGGGGGQKENLPAQTGSDKNKATGSDKNKATGSDKKPKESLLRHSAQAKNVVST